MIRIWTLHIYLNMYGILSFGGTLSPNKADSTAIFNKTLLTISPKNVPEISFSKIWNKEILVWNSKNIYKIPNRYLIKIHEFLYPISRIRAFSIQTSIKLSNRKMTWIEASPFCTDSLWIHRITTCLWCSP